MQKVIVKMLMGIKPVNDMMRACDMPAVYLPQEATITFNQVIDSKHLTEDWKEKVIEAFNKAGDKEFEFTDFKFELVEEL